MTKKKEGKNSNSSDAISIPLNNSDTISIPIGEMKPAAEYSEIFGAFDRKHCFVNKIMSSASLDEKYPLIVRKAKKIYDILCGVGRYKAALNQQELVSNLTDSIISLPCKIVDLKEEDALLLILKDNFETCRTITGFSEYQFYLLGRLLHHGDPKNHTKEELVERVTSELNFSKTKFDQLEQITEIILTRSKQRSEREKREDEDSNYEEVEQE